MASYRDPTPEEMLVVERQLAELRRVFFVWSDNYDDEYDLLWFAYYEGCAEPIMATSAPFVVCNSLVKKDDFRWVMVPKGEVWLHGVVHPCLSEPIDVHALEKGEWYRPEADDEPPHPGEAAQESRDFIKLVVDWKRIKGRDAPIPKGSLFEVEEQVARSRNFGRPPAC